MPDRRDAPPLRSDLLAAAGVFLVALVPRLLYILDLRRAGLIDFLRLDPLYYHEWALRIARGDWLGRDVFEMSPLYPYALGALYHVAGESLLTPRVLQAILGSLTCAGTVLLGSRLFGRAAGGLAGTLLALYGPAIFYDGQINKTTLALALTVAFAGCLVASRARRGGWIAAGGAALGLAALVHENVNVAAPIALLWLAAPRAGEPRRGGLLPAAFFVAGFAAAVLPATIRNAAVAGEFVLITSGGGENFYTGNHAGASGRYGPPPFVRPDPFYEHEDFRVEAARRLGHPVSRAEASRFWWEEGLRWIAGSPLGWVRLLGDKFSVFFNAFERPDNFSYYNFRRFSPILSMPLVSFGIVAPLAAVGVAASIARWRDLVPLYAGFGAYFLSAMIFFTQSRYRMPAVPFLCLFAAHGAVSLASWARDRRVPALAGGVAALTAVFLFVNRDPGNSPGFDAQNEAILGELYFHADRLDDAAAAFRRGIEALDPRARAGDVTLARVAGAARYGLGLTELRRGNEAAAESALAEAGACPDPDVRADALVELAGLRLRRGDLAGVADALAGAAEARPGDFRLHLRAGEALHKAGRPREALDQVAAALAITPPPPPVEQADAWYGAALARIALGDRDGALEALRRTIALNPAHPRADWIRGTIAALEGGP